MFLNPFYYASGGEVEAAYREILGRAPDSGGRDFYTNPNLTAAQVRAQLADSPEGRAFAASQQNTNSGSSGIIAQTKAAAAAASGGGGGGSAASPNVQQQTEQLLRERLGTTPTQDQINYWGGIFGLDNVITPDEITRLDTAIGNAGNTPGQSTIADTILSGQQPQQPQQPVTPTTPTTPGGTGQGTAPPPGFLGVRPIGTAEYNPFYAGPDARSDLVNMAYERLLNRPADQAGLAHYGQEMIKGLTGQGLVKQLTSSPEFQRTQDFQRAYTSTFRPGYQEFGPTGQYNQPIYLSSYTNYARSPEFAQPLYNTTMMTPQDLGYGFGSFNPFAYGGTNPFADEAAAPTGGTATGGDSTAAAIGGRIKNDDGIAALLKR